MTIAWSWSTCWKKNRLEDLRATGHFELADIFMCGRRSRWAWAMLSSARKFVHDEPLPCCWGMISFTAKDPVSGS